MPGDDRKIEKSGLKRYVGLIPAAGFGARLPDRKAAKEMLAVGHSRTPVIEHLLHCMEVAGLREVAIVLRPEKRDLTDFLQHEKWQHMLFHLRFTPGTSGVPETVSLGLEDLEECSIVFGFPDILFEPGHAVHALTDCLEEGDADIVLGLFPTGSPDKSDMVKTNKGGNVIDIEIKPRGTKLDLTWILAAWRPTFSRYLIDLLQHDGDRLRRFAASSDDQQLGQVFLLAMADGLKIQSVAFTNGRSLDVGTEDDLRLAQAWPD
ncbi:MAG: hypothetical protein ACR2Q3_13870 [Woeseiaceae bacterium]